MLFASGTSLSLWLSQTNHEVSPDSFLIFRVAREVVEEQGFDEVLEAVLNRVGEIEKSRKVRCLRSILYQPSQ